MSQDNLLPGEFRTMNKLDIVINGKKVFRDSRLHKLEQDSISFILPLTRGYYEPVIYKEHNLNLSSIDEIVISHRKKSMLYSTAGGIVLGSISYLVARQIFNKPKEQFSTNIIGQDSVDGPFEQYLAGVLGVGLGITIGKTLAELKVFPKKDKKVAYWKMRKFID
jgi:hypothetical protein